MDKLPEYEPSDEIWNNIETKLGEDGLRQGIQHLPQYEPSAETWEQIESELTPKIVSLFAWRWTAAAASVVLVVGLSWLYQSTNQPITYSQEVVNKKLLLQDLDNSDADYAMIDRKSVV